MLAITLLPTLYTCHSPPTHLILATTPQPTLYTCHNCVTYTIKILLPSSIPYSSTATLLHLCKVVSRVLGLCKPSPSSQGPYYINQPCKVLHLSLMHWLTQCGLRCWSVYHAYSFFITPNTHLSAEDLAHNLYLSLPGLLGDAMYSHPTPDQGCAQVLIQQNQIWGHVAFYNCLPGTFGIKTGVRMLVDSLHHNQE